MIPITQAMGIRIAAVGPDGLRVAVPLAPNLNHAETAFGGSIATAGIITCWALVHVMTREADLAARVIIQRSEIEYLRPIAGDFEVFCPRPHPEAWASLLAAVQRQRSGRIDLRAQVWYGGKVAAEYAGAYVAVTR